MGQKIPEIKPKRTAIPRLLRYQGWYAHIISRNLQKVLTIEELEDLKVGNIGVINSPFTKKYSDKIKKTISKNRYVLAEAKKEFIPKETLKKDECVDKIINRIKKDLKKNKKSLAVIIHNDNPQKAKELKEKLKALNVLVSFTNFVDPVMSLKMGYKGLMVSYIKL